MAGHYNWTVSIPESQLDITPKYVLSFKPALNGKYDASGPELLSPLFLVIMKMDTTHSASLPPLSSPTSSISFTSTTTLFASSVTPTPLPSASLTTIPKSLGLSTGAKVGLCVGLFLLVLTICSLLAILSFRRTRHQRELVELLKSAEEMRYASIAPSSVVEVVEGLERDAGIPVPQKASVHTSAQPDS